MDVPHDRSLVVVIPTYNEVENLGDLVRRLRASVPRASILIVDDGSPDGTGELAERIAADDGRVHVMHRVSKEGLGAAYIAGFSWCLERRFECIAQMDADGSHQPEELPRLLAALNGADAVLGSRWTHGGTVVNWPQSRKALSMSGNGYARLLMGIPIHDATGGFRVFHSYMLESIGLSEVASRGYCFQIDVVRRAIDLGFRVTEVPIEFIERERGRSKMSRSIVVEALWRVTLWGLERRLSRRRTFHQPTAARLPEDGP
jgi:dolichol-phosphate mannosyltransferase